METNNWRSTPPGGEPSRETADWRTHLQPESRQRIVNKIMDALKRHLPFSGQEGLNELKKIGERLEEKIYTAATSQSDYLRRISLKMLSMEPKSQNAMSNSLPPNGGGPGGPSNKPSDPASLDSTAQTGHANGGDWQEEVYQKIKSMKEMYLPELNEMYQKIATKLQQHDSIPQPPRSEQLEKLKLFKTMLERIITFLQVSKSNISPNFKEKLSSYEKQIVNFISTNRPRKPSMQQGLLPSTHMHSMQQPQTQISQVQSHDNQMNPQMQSMNLQGSVATMQQNNTASLQHNAISSIPGISTAQQNILNSLQPTELATWCSKRRRTTPDEAEDVCLILGASDKNKVPVKNDLEPPENPAPQNPVMEAPEFSCPICMGPLNEATTTKCGHIFCKGCIETAIATQSNCPTCRQKVGKRSIFRVYLPSFN